MDSTTVTSPLWDGELPEITVVVSTYRRPQYLPELFAALETQTLEEPRFEVVVVDNGSGDTTWDELVGLVGLSPLRACAHRLEHNRGPGGGRNAGFRHGRAPLVAITDDDCLPTPDWLAHLLAAFAEGADVLQAPIVVDPRADAARGWWDHTINILGPTPWFETSNVAYRRSFLDLVGGFDETDTLTAQHGGGRAFGEDAVLGARVLAAGARRTWVPEAVVHHRVVPSSYRRQLREWRNLTGFPGLIERSAVGRASLYRRIFLNYETARFDAALAGIVAAAALRRSWPLFAAMPWAAVRWGPIRVRSRNGAEAALRLAQRGVLEAVGFVSLAEGSVRHRRLVL